MSHHSQRVCVHITQAIRTVNVPGRFTVQEGFGVCFLTLKESDNPNPLKSYKISQKLSPKHAACGVAQLSYPIYKHEKACLSKQPQWRAAGDPRLARAGPGSEPPAPVGEGGRKGDFFCTFPPNPRKC